MTHTTNPTSDLLSLADFLVELRRFTGASVSYAKGQRAALDGRIPVEKREGGRCLIRRDNVPVAAVALGLTTRSAA